MPDPKSEVPKKKAVRRPAAAKAVAKPAAKEEKAADRSRCIVLFRHGIAEDRAPDRDDAERGLTAEGHDKMKRAARGLEEIFPKAEALVASPLIRSVQTALWITKAYRDRLKVQTTEALSPGSSPDEVVRMLEKLDARRIILVGHEPNLSELAAHLSGADSGFRADLGKAGAIGIRIDESGRGTIEWMLTPKMLRALA